MARSYKEIAGMARSYKEIAGMARSHQISLWERATPATILRDSALMPTPTAVTLKTLVKEDPDMRGSHSDYSSARHPKGSASLRRGRFSEPGRIYFLTFVVLHRQRVFADGSAARQMAASLADDPLAGSHRIHAWVVMPDHVHALLGLAGEEALSVAVARMKSGSSRRVNACLGRSGALWTPGFHDHAVRDDESLERTVEYLLANPVRAGIVDRPGDYEYSWSRWGK